MLPDPQFVSTIDSTTGGTLVKHTVSQFALVDAGNGRARRVASANLFAAGAVGLSTLSISHSVSKENKTIPTDRTMIRLDTPLFAGSADGQAVNAYAYIVVGVPRGPLFGNTAIAPGTVPVRLVETMFGCVLADYYPLDDTTLLGNNTLLRVIAGES